MKIRLTSPIWRLTLYALAIAFAASFITLIVTARSQFADARADIRRLHTLGSVARAAQELRKTQSTMADGGRLDAQAWRRSAGRFEKASSGLSTKPGGVGEISAKLASALARADEGIARVNAAIRGADLQGADEGAVAGAAIEALSMSMAPVKSVIEEAQIAITSVRARSAAISMSLTRLWRWLEALAALAIVAVIAASLLFAAFQRAHLQLHRKEERLRHGDAVRRSLHNLQSDYLFRSQMDDEGRLSLEWIEGAFTRITGYTLDDLRGPNEWLKLMHPDEVKQSQGRISGLASGQPQDAECRIISKTGETLWVRIVTSPERDPATGRIIAVVGSGEDITARKHMEEALRTSEQDYRGIFENAHDAIMIFDPDDENVINVNRSACELYGFSREEFLRLRLSDITFDPDRGKQRIRETLKQGSLRGFETAHRHKSGAKMCLEVNASVVQYKDRRAILSINRDVTSRRRAEEALRESELRHRAIVEDQTEMVVRFTPDGTLTFVNDAYCRQTGASREELVGRDFFDLLLDEEKAAVREHLKSFTPEDSVKSAEHRVVLPGGEIRWRAWTNRALFDDDGALHEFQGVGRDVTERKAAEDALRQSEQMLRSFFDANAMSMGVIELGEEGVRLLELNDAAAADFHMPREELIGRLAFDCEVPRETIALWEKHCRIAARNSAPARFEYQTELRKRWISATVCRIEKTQGERERFAFVTEDVTKRKQDEAWLRMLNRELNHRVKNNLAVVAALADRTAAGATTVEVFTQRLQGRILAMSRAHHLIADHQGAGAPLRDLLEKCLGDFRVGEHGGVELDGPDVTLGARQCTMLSLAVRELAANAAKYGALSTPDGEVRLSWSVQGDDNARRILINWSERGGPVVRSPSHTGFGTELIEQIIRHDMAGEVEIRYGSGGVTCAINMPATDAARAPNESAGGVEVETDGAAGDLASREAHSEGSS